MNTGENELIYFDIYTNSIYNINISDSICIYQEKYLLNNPMPYNIYANINDFPTKQMDYDFFLKTICIKDKILAFYVNNKKINGFEYEIGGNNTVNAFKYIGWLPNLMYYKDGIIYSIINTKNIEINKKIFKKEIPDSLYNQPNEIIFKFKYNK